MSITLKLLREPSKSLRTNKDVDILDHSKYTEYQETSIWQVMLREMLFSNWDNKVSILITPTRSITFPLEIRKISITFKESSQTYIWTTQWMVLQNSQNTMTEERKQKDLNLCSTLLLYQAIFRKEWEITMSISLCPTMR